MMQAFGVHYLSAGENIGWNTGGSTSAINNEFMNSSEHRSNILNPNFTDLGVGSATSGSSAWTGGGGSYTNAWMFSVEFAQLRGSPPPTTTATATTTTTTAPPARAGAGAGAGAQRPGGSRPGATPWPRPRPSPQRHRCRPSTPAPTPVPTPTPLPTLTLPPTLPAPGGLLFDSVESVLESYLIY